MSVLISSPNAVSSLLKYPIDNGIVTNWTDMEKNLALHILQRTACFL